MSSGQGNQGAAIGRYVKKPIEVEAVQFDGTKESANEILAWIGVNGGYAVRVDRTSPALGLLLETLHGRTRVQVGDWVVRGPSGDFWPVRGDIFAESYELVAPVPVEPQP